nr:shikimate kinase [Pseudobdellovibrionaceae bacterium]
MGDFHFRGQIPASKSLLNRALILKSHASRRLTIHGESDADDVAYLRKALGKIEDGRDFYLGDGGTTLRFFALRVSREKGSFGLKMTERLFNRPQGALKDILTPLGVEIEPGEGASSFVLRSAGWVRPKTPLRVPTRDSSQFASALVLNAWNLDFPLEIEFSGAITSESYFRMTLDLCRQAGMDIQETEKGLLIPAGQTMKTRELFIEPDLSSMFSVAALAALSGDARIENFPDKALQPDGRFPEILSKMGVFVERDKNSLVVQKAETLKPVDVDLALCPDLVPVLAVLCAFAEGKSVLRGAPQLRHKESDRIRSTAKLLGMMGVSVQEREDGLEIAGNPALSMKEFTFDPDHDHRLAMAAGLLISKGWPIRVSDPDVVTKSFPEYWSLLKTGPHLLIGHRGAGKTSLLERRTNGRKYDLDAEIEKRTGQAVFDFFRDRGEEIFRQTEVSVLTELLETASSQDWIALGAGVRLDQVPVQGEKIWIRRDTDHDGRVFLDRPRLDPNSDPLSEFRERARIRERHYERFADRVYTLPEGLREPDEIEEKILSGNFFDTGGAVTLLPIHRKSIPQLGANYYELRDDLLDQDEIRSFFGKLNPSQVIYSVRKHRHIPEEILNSSCWIDWALDVFYPEKDFVREQASRLILSSHGTLNDALLDFRIYAQLPVHLKLSPAVESFEELKAGHAWWNADPSKRSFLPRSAQGRWGWYRLWMKDRMKINYWREGTGTSLDQPTLSAWLATPSRPDCFAAVLGNPVHHSWTPAEHRRFFAEINAPVWAVEVREEEWSQAFPFLTDLGLRFAA